MKALSRKKIRLEIGDVTAAGKVFWIEICW
jgi:hypothetical protein